MRRLARAILCRSAATAAVLAAMASAGCEAGRGEELLTEEHVQARWLPPITDGRTTKHDVAMRLGEPSDSLEGGRILGYRLVLVEGETEVRKMPPMPMYVVGPPGPGTYENDRFAARLEELDKSGVLSVVRVGDADRRPMRLATRAGEYTLVLIVEPSGVVSRHALHRVWP